MSSAATQPAAAPPEDAAAAPPGDRRDPLQPPAPFRGRLDQGLTWVMLLACCLATSKSLADPDLWGHVQYGRDLLREGLPAAATYTYTAIGHPWINHEHLAEILLAIGSLTIGGAGMLLLKALAGLAVFHRLVRRGEQQDASRTAIFLVLLLTAANLMHFWSLRPQLLTFLCFFLLLELLDGESRRTPDRPRGRGRLWLAVPLMLVWANSHGGFVVGLVTAGVFFAGRLLPALILGGGVRPGFRGERFRDAARHGLVLAGMLAATLANPYGWGLHAWLLQSLGRPRPEIVEWLPPEVLSVAWLPFWLAAAAACLAWLCSRRPRDWAQGLVLALLLYAAVSHRRHIALFALAFGYWITPHLDDLLRRLGAGRDESPLDASLSPAARPWAAAGLILAGLALIGMWVGQSYRIPVRRDGYPVTAVQFMADHNIHGRLVSRFKWAQYLIAVYAARPAEEQVQLAFDGRFRTCYPQEMVDMYFDFALGEDSSIQRSRSEHSPPPDGGRILEHLDPELVLIDRSQAAPVALLNERREQWTLLYQDQVAQLWGRRRIFDSPGDRRYVAPQFRRITDEPQQGSVAWPALPRFRPRPLPEPALTHNLRISS